MMQYSSPRAARVVDGACPPTLSRRSRPSTNHDPLTLGLTPPCFGDIFERDQVNVHRELTFFHPVPNLFGGLQQGFGWNIARTGKPDTRGAQLFGGEGENIADPLP
jgi:hypothetical protein